MAEDRDTGSRSGARRCTELTSPCDRKVVAILAHLTRCKINVSIQLVPSISTALYKSLSETVVDEAA